MKLVQITDTHLVGGGEALYGLDPRARLDACVADIEARHADADLVVVTGDLTHWGKRIAYEDFKAAISRLTPPVRLMLGNHDDRATFRDVFPEQPVDADGFVQSVIDTARERLVLLDTNEPGVPWGRLCGKRLGWLKARLEESDLPVLLFMHHPPFPTGLAHMDTIALREPEAFTEVVRPYAARIRHLFFGHVHRPVSGNWRGISFSTLRGTNHQVAFDLTRKEKVGGSHEPPAYAVVLVGPEAIVVHTHDYLDRTATFDL